MAAPTTWKDDGTLQAFMLDALGTVASLLGWGVSDVLESLNDLLLALGHDSAAEIPATQMRESRALARLYAWRKAVPALAGLHSFTADKSQYDLSKVMAQAKEALAAAEADAYEFNPAYAISTVAVVHKHDPYIMLDDDERTLN